MISTAPNCHSLLPLARQMQNPSLRLNDSPAEGYASHVSLGRDRACRVWPTQLRTADRQVSRSSAVGLDGWIVLLDITESEQASIEARGEAIAEHVATKGSLTLEWPTRSRRTRTWVIIRW